MSINKRQTEWRDEDGEHTGSLGVLTAHTQAPVMPQTAMSSDLLQSLDIVPQFRVEIV